MKYNIEDILNKAYTSEDETFSAENLNQEVMSKVSRVHKKNGSIKGMSTFTKYAIALIGLCLIATVTVSAYLIIEPYIVDKEGNETQATVTRWKVEGDTLIISGYGPMNANNRDTTDQWFDYSEVIKKVVIEEGVTSIDGIAFKDFVVLESVNIPESVTEIEGYAFENCVSLKSIDIPDTVTEISDEVFKGCSNLEDIKMTKNLSKLGANAFNDTKWYKNLEKDGMLVLDGVLYSGANAIGDVVLDENIRVVANGAFCTSEIESVKISANIDEIEYMMFMDCDKLKSVKITSEIQTIDTFAFRGCTSLQNVELPNSVKEIKDNAFENCIMLQSIRLPGKLETIGENVWLKCDSLKTIYGVGGSLAEKIALMGDYEFVEVEEGEFVQNDIAYDGYDYISPIYHNQTWKYNSKEIGCEVYEWSENIVLPVPKPEGESALEILQGQYYLLGIDENEWNAYVSKMSEKFLIEREDDEYMQSSIINFTDYENNFTGYIQWGGEVDGDMKNYCTGQVFVGTKYRSTKFSNNEVLDMVMKEIGAVDKKGFSIVSVNSQKYCEDGFDVFLISASNEYAYANDFTKNFICIMKNNEIVFLEKTSIMWGLTDTIEFLQVGDTWKCYMVKLNLSMNSGQDLIEYEMVDNKFVKVQEINIPSLLDSNIDVILRKDSDVIVAYELIFDGSFEPPYYGWYSVGEKIFTIDDEGIKELD